MNEAEHTPEQCRDLFARLSEYLDQELDETAYRAIENHLDNCPTCRVCVATLRRTIELCRQFPSQPVRQAFSDQMKTMYNQLSRK